MIADLMLGGVIGISVGAALILLCHWVQVTPIKKPRRKKAEEDQLSLEKKGAA